MPLSCNKAQVSLRFVEGGKAHAEGSEIFIILDHVIIPASDDKCDAFVCKHWPVDTSHQTMVK